MPVPRRRTRIHLGRSDVADVCCVCYAECTRFVFKKCSAHHICKACRDGMQKHRHVNCPPCRKRVAVDDVVVVIDGNSASALAAPARTAMTPELLQQIRHAMYEFERLIVDESLETVFNIDRVSRTHGALWELVQFLRMHVGAVAAGEVDSNASDRALAIAIDVLVNNR